MRVYVYVGGLPFGVREQDLKKFFKSVGRTRDILIKNGYGFVEFENCTEAADAIYKLNGNKLLGERVVVSAARYIGQVDRRLNNRNGATRGRKNKRESNATSKQHANKRRKLEEDASTNEEDDEDADPDFVVDNSEQNGKLKAVSSIDDSSDSNEGISEPTPHKSKSTDSSYTQPEKSKPPQSSTGLTVPTSFASEGEKEQRKIFNSAHNGYIEHVRAHSQ